MIVVIQCAGRKNPEAGHLRRLDGSKVMFVGDPNRVPAGQNAGSLTYARPDDQTEAGHSWRTELLQYNDSPNGNPLGLLAAWRLYQNAAYALLAEKFGTDRMYILSAGWGLISAKFLTPNYDITFSNQAEAYKQRRKNDHFEDFCMLPADVDEPIVFFVCSAYIPLACQLTRDIKANRYLFYRSTNTNIPDVKGFTLVKYQTTTKTNWHYECANDFLQGRISTGEA